MRKVQNGLAMPKCERKERQNNAPTEYWRLIPSGYGGQDPAALQLANIGQKFAKFHSLDHLYIYRLCHLEVDQELSYRSYGRNSSQTTGIRVKAFL